MFTVITENKAKQKTNLDLVIKKYDRVINQNIL